MSSRLVSQSWENGLSTGFGRIEENRNGGLCLKQGFFVPSDDTHKMGKRIHHVKTPSTSSNSSLGSLEEDDETASTTSTSETDISDLGDYPDAKSFHSFEESPFPPSPHQPLPHIQRPIPSVIRPTSNHFSLKDFSVPPPAPIRSLHLDDTAHFPAHQQEPFVLQSDISRRLQRLQTASPADTLPLHRLAMTNSYRQLLAEREGQIAQELAVLRHEMQMLLSTPPNWMVLKKAEWITNRMQYLCCVNNNLPSMKAHFEESFIKAEESFGNAEWDKWEMKKEQIRMVRDGEVMVKKRNMEVLAKGF